MFKGRQTINMKNIFIWGTGKTAESLIKNGLSGEVKGYIETVRRKDRFCNKKVYELTELSEDYDVIIVANNHGNEIYQKVARLNFDIEKMIFMYPSYCVDSNKNTGWIREILGEINFEIYCANHGLLDKTFFAHDKELYNELNRRDTFKIDESILRPMIKDRYESGGTVNSYFWQDLWAAQLIFTNQPEEHYDIGSRLDGFISHILSFGIPVNMIDIRPLPMKIAGLHTIVDNATDMNQFEDSSIASLSALCSLEHFGLGRYGDPIDPEACFRCFDAIQKKVKRGGKIYISVPIGKERLEFNAHRIFCAETIKTCFDKCMLLEFSCTADGRIERNVELKKYDADTCNGGDRFGLFYFEKI